MAIVEIKTGKTLKKEINAQAVDRLVELLAQARAGDITEFVAIYKVNGEYTHCWTGCDNLIELLGQLARMSHQMQKRMDAL